MSLAEVSLSGFDHLDRQLARFERGLSPEQKAEALHAGARLIAAEERALVPRRSGNLARSITVEMYPTNLQGDGSTIFIGPRIGKGGPDGWYGYIVEVGTEHSRAQPFVRPAVDRKGKEAIGLVVSKLREDTLRLAA